VTAALFVATAASQPGNTGTLPGPTTISFHEDRAAWSYTKGTSPTWYGISIKVWVTGAAATNYKVKYYANPDSEALGTHLATNPVLTNTLDAPFTGQGVVTDKHMAFSTIVESDPGSTFNLPDCSSGWWVTIELYDSTGTTLLDSKMSYFECDHMGS
jgi:hypothetical protein